MKTEWVKVEEDLINCDFYFLIYLNTLKNNFYSSAITNHIYLFNSMRDHSPRNV